MRRRLTIAAIAILIAYWGFMFFATHTTSLNQSRLLEHGDKFAHFAAYAVLAWLLAMVLRGLDVPLRRACLIVVVVGAAYAAIDEWLQQFTRRHADFYDWLADVIGIGFGLIVVCLTHNMVRGFIHRLMERRKRSRTGL